VENTGPEESVQLVLIGAWAVSVVLLLLAMRSWSNRWIKDAFVVVAALALVLSAVMTLVAALSF